MVDAWQSGTRISTTFGRIAKERMKYATFHIFFYRKRNFRNTALARDKCEYN